ncbi:MAG: peptidylprolyl isomerase [Bacteroidia bacterium]|nr:peptidylprolyl isomerase [Bacteroidia bacterium]
MKRNYFLLIPVFLIFTIGFSGQSLAQSKKKKKKSKVLLTFDKETVSKDEFERVYAKNNSNGGKENVKTHTPEQYREYLDLYVNFKRKVFAAEAEGLQNTTAFKREFEQYRKQLVQPYLSAKDVEDKLIQEAYDRSGYLIDASHLLIRLAEDASPDDTLAKYNNLLEIRDSIMVHDKDFAEMAKKYSEDPSASKNEGNLGYFSAFAMVYPFESAAYNTKVGEVSMPVRTQFGYHLVKVNDRISNEGTKRAAHIIVRVGDRYSASNDEKAKEIINEIYEKLKSGGDFAELAQQYSDDPNTAKRGGDLGTNRLLPAMEKYKYQLKAGSFSEPFKTSYGYHILKVTEVSERGSFDESKAALKQKISRDSRSQISKKALLNRIKTENKFQDYAAPLDSFKKVVDGNFLRASWKPDTLHKGLYEQVLFSMGKDYKATVQSLIDFYLKKRPRNTSSTISAAVNKVYNNFLESELLAYEEKLLPEKNDEYRYLLQEYRDGILLFTLMEKKVWKKAVEDTTGLQAFYESNKDSFKADARIDVREYRSSDKDALAKALTMLKAGSTEAQIDSAFNAENPLNIRLTSMTYEKGQGLIDEALFEEGEGHISGIIESGNFFRAVKITEKRPAGIRTFDEAKSAAITRYQDYLEKTWLEELANTYPVKINEKTFSKLFK